MDIEGPVPQAKCLKSCWVLMVEIATPPILENGKSNFIVAHHS